jgi:carbonic anhydrase/acetyltransferase-like protein (isoleucine patch superfamily)
LQFWGLSRKLLANQYDSQITSSLQKIQERSFTIYFCVSPAPLEVHFMIRSYQGHAPQIPSSCYIDVSAQILGDVVRGERSSVWMNAVLRGDVNSIRVGSFSNVQDCSVLHGQRNLYSVTVGDWVTIGHNATVHGCVVEDHCVIGMGARVLNNSRIGEGCIIAAGTVIPENSVVPPHTLWAGVPGKLRRELTDKDRALILEYAQNYLDYVDIYLSDPPKVL